VPLIVTAPVARRYTGPVKLLPLSLSVTPEAILIVVKLKILSPAGFSGGVKVFGSKRTTPGVVRFKAPSAPVDPLLNV